MRHRFLALALLAPLAALASGLTGNETISTIAGTGALAASGDGGPASAATLSVYHLQAGASGNLYFADGVNYMVRRIDAAGNISAVAGNGTAAFAGDNGPATQASLYGPLGVAVDAQGNLYIADRGNNRIRKVAAGTGIITTFAGASGSFGSGGDGGPATLAGLHNPYSVTAAPDGSIYIADSDNHRVRKVSPAGIITTVAGNGAAAASGGEGDGGRALQAALNLPVDVALDAAGNLYILDAAWKRVRRVDTAGNISTYAGGGTLGAEGTPAAQFQFALPGRGIAVDAFGNLFVSDNGPGSNYVRKIDAATPHAVSIVAGTGVSGFSGDGGPARLAQVQGGNGLEFDAAGNLYIGDFGRIRKIRAQPPAADLAVRKQAAGTSVTLGQEVRFSVIVNNNGPDAATGVQLNDFPQTPVNRVLAQQPPWNCTTNAPVRCALQQLPAGQGAPPVEVTLLPTAEGQYCNSATVLSGESDPAPANNVSPQVCVTVVRAFKLNEFVAFASEHLLIDRRSRVASGAVGANTRAANNTPEVLIRGTPIQHPAFFVLGDSVLLDGARIANVRSNEPVQLLNGAAVGVQQPAGSFPSLVLPALQAANPETQASGDILVAANQARSLAPGRYRNVVVNEGATLNLNGFIHIGDPPGTPRSYDFRGIELKAGARILFGAPPVALATFPLGMQVRVQERIRTAGEAVIGPASAQGGLNGSHIVFHVGGSDLPELQPQNVVYAVNIGRNSRLRANVYAPNGSVLLNVGVNATGAFIGRNFAGNAVALTLESAFQP